MPMCMFMNICVMWSTIQVVLINNIQVSKVLQYFVKKHTATILHLTWYSPSATHWICLYALEHSLRIYGFRPTWPFLIIGILTTEWNFFNFLFTVINSSITFYTTIIFSYICGVMDQSVVSVSVQIPVILTLRWEICRWKQFYFKEYQILFFL